MLISIDDFKTILKATINSSHKKSGKHLGVTVMDIKKDLRYHENIDVDEFVKKNGYRDLLDLLKDWNEFTIHHDTHQPTVQIIESCADHISKMNENLKKKKGTIRSITKEIRSHFNLNISDAEDLNEDISKDNSNEGSSTKETPRLAREKMYPNSREMKAHRPINMKKSFNNAMNTIVNSHMQTKVKPFKIVKTIDHLIHSSKTLDLQNMNMMQIVLLDVVNPHRFWFAIYNEYKILNKLMNKMQEFYSVNQDLLRVDEKFLQRGLYVAALYNGIWHRGLIIKKNAEIIRIFYIDFGTVDDISFTKLCYLELDFFSLPSIARRGVLAFIQPKINDKWSNKAKVFFEKSIKNVKIDAKIFKYNSIENSYYLGIKYKNDQNNVKLLTNSMIFRKLAKADLNFLEHETLSRDCYKFSDYEEGILLDINTKSPNQIENFESWMPIDDTNTFEIQTKNASVNNKTIECHEIPQEQSETKILYFSEKQKVNKSIIKKQSFEKFTVGGRIDIFINVFYEASCFFFYIKCEIDDIRKFLDNLNNSYKYYKEPFSNVDELEVNTEVVILNNNNYCRGRVNSKFKDIYQVFLLDFGVFVNKRFDEIFRLQKEFTKQQRFIYKGSIQETSLYNGEKQFISAKIIGIRNEETIDLII